MSEDLALAGTYASSAEGFDHGLVVLAMGLSYWLVRDESGYRLLIEGWAAEPVREQLEKFDRESLRWPPPPLPLSTRKAEFTTPLLWTLVVLAAFTAQTRWPGQLEAVGAIDRDAIFSRGEWWRLGTALFLHADFGHLVSNLVCGLFVFSAVVSTLGRWRGWLLLFLASVAGNLAATAVHYGADYRSLGASTAIFAGLGLLTGRAMLAALQADHPHRWRNLFMPLAAGAALLGLYGAGGPDVDVLAHLMGFSAGLLLGVPLG